ncbi:hypothetical protein OVA10_11330 [Lelliottia sp. SL45]|uniref:hypothetical protein n=1 Tax=Lelliottia sp. SL45 TaxID=2994665 RepID=UPI00227277A7|nr:hypothetical protein [Lelliottia sp. SL45]MCY1698636.1 hypothetical protein [Lelliottia sp. SL45]
MFEKLDEIGKDAPDISSVPDWLPPVGAIPNPETANQKHPDEREQDVADRIANRQLREKFADKAYKVVKYGLYWWGSVILLAAAGKATGKEVISDSVLIAITSASTLNLFAAFLGVIRGLFPKGSSEK